MAAIAINAGEPMAGLALGIDHVRASLDLLSGALVSARHRSPRPDRPRPRPCGPAARDDRGDKAMRLSGTRILQISPLRQPALGRGPPGLTARQGSGAYGRGVMKLRAFPGRIRHGGIGTRQQGHEPLRARCRKRVAFANYRLDAVGKVIITHTETPRALRGRGIASELIKGALDLIRATDEGRSRDAVSSSIISTSIRNLQT